MANRDLSNFRDVTQVQGKLAGQELIAAGEMGQKIVDMSQKAKVAEGLSAAQLEIAKLDTDFRIKNEANPFDKKAIDAYKSQRKAVLGKYNSDIGSLWANDFSTQAATLEGNSDLQMQNWGYKQAEINTLTSIDTMGQNNKQLMMQHGVNYGKTGEGDLDAILDFEASRQQLVEFAKTSGAVGEVTANKILGAYDSEMASAFVGAVASENPYRAKNLLDSGQFDASINVEDRIKLSKTIDRGIKRSERAAVTNGLKMLKMQIEDPANFYAKQGLDLDQIVEAQGSEENASVIPNKEAELLATKINQIKDPAELETALQNINQTYGYYSQNALNDLSKNGLNNNARITMTLMNTEDADQATVQSFFDMGKLRDAQGKPVEPQKLAQDILTAKGEGIKISDVTTAALEKTKGWLEVNISGKNDPADTAFIGQKVQDLAAYYITQGYDVEQATNKATGWLTEGSAITQIGNHKFMLPATLAEDDFFEATAKDVLEDKIDSIKLSDIYTDDITTETGYTPEAYLNAIKVGGGWVNARDGKNLMLVDNKGLYVLDKKGKIISTPIADLEKKQIEETLERDPKAKLAIGVGLFNRYQSELE